MAETPRKTANKAAKTGKPSGRNGNVLPVGNHPGNTGGKKGRSGRKPDAFSNMLAKLRQSPALAKSLKKAIADPESRAFPSALKVLTDYDTERPTKKLMLSMSEELANYLKDL